MKITLIFPTLPPQFDGIGDYTVAIAHELGKSHVVQILTATHEPTPIKNVEIRTVLDSASPASIRNIVTPTMEFQPDWVVVQFNPFSYGKWGRYPHLIPALRQIRQRLPNVRIALMVHESFVPIIGLRFAIMASWQWPLFFRLGRNADIIFVSIEQWARRFQRWFPHIPVHHLPVGSNMPLIAIAREEARRRLDIDAETFVIGIFGTTHPSRMFDWVGDAVRHIQQIHSNTIVLYVGPHVEAMRALLGPDVSLRADGAASPDEVSRRFAAMDVHLAPYIDGVSTRRGAFMTGIQHGIASVSTCAFNTDRVLLEENNKAFLLSTVENREEFVSCVERLFRDTELRHTMGAAAARLYADKFDWKPICQLMCSYLDRVPKRNSS